jgi:predicted aldo/keto reductase-like oxidoreductase
MGKTRVPLLFGTMTLGEAGKNGTRNSDMTECQQILETYFSSGSKELDTARMYAEGTTEEVCFTECERVEAAVCSSIPTPVQGSDQIRVIPASRHDVARLSSTAL